MVTREKNGDGEIRGKAIEARRGEAARASAAVARVGRAPDGAARARAWIRRGEGVERAQLRVRVPRGANSYGPRGAERRFGRRKKSCQVRVQFTVIEKSWKKILSSSFFHSIQLISLFDANTHTIQPSYYVPYSLVSNFSRLKGVPAGVRALLESRERHERRRRTRRIYSKYHDAPAQSKISHQSL